ncbi:uncharacterized protein LOC127834984 [Dreissena polymorpha]|nr:uncharacterized protein LOC127834984 [Dreissena polymorpha]
MAPILKGTRNRTHIHHVWKCQMSVKKCLVNSRLFGSVILNHILIMCIRSHHRHLRLHLAALHSVANANRKQAETRQGGKRYRLSYPKYKAGHHVVKAVKENCTYDYVDEVMAELLRMKEEYKSDANARAASGNILFSLPPLSSSANRILKSEAVQK